MTIGTQQERDHVDRRLELLTRAGAAPWIASTAATDYQNEYATLI